MSAAIKPDSAQHKGHLAHLKAEDESKKKAEIKIEPKKEETKKDK